MVTVAAGAVSGCGGSSMVTVAAGAVSGCGCFGLRPLPPCPLLSLRCEPLRRESRPPSLSWRMFGRSGLGIEALGSTSISNISAICGSAGASRLMVASSSSLTTSGLRIGLISARIGENAAASSIAIQRSGLSIGANEAFTLSARRRAISTGKGTPAFGGWDDSRRARMTRPTASAASTSPNHSTNSCSCL